jgi:hypothetical protein
MDLPKITTVIYSWGRGGTPAIRISGHVLGDLSHYNLCNFCETLSHIVLLNTDDSLDRSGV